MPPKRTEYISKLYVWLAKNNIDIIYDNNIIETVMKQLSSELIDPDPELLSILENLLESEVKNE